MQENERAFVGYEYKEVTVNAARAAMYTDCYRNFGWTAEEPVADSKDKNCVIIRMKRDRKMINRMELTRLQRNYEACLEEIEMLEREKTKTALVWSLTAGIIGTVCMTGATFAVTHEPPVIWLCILLSVPGLIGWILPWSLYPKIVKKQAQRLQPLIEEKQNEIYEVCEKGYSLL